jgi:5-enolpyruvylshikimate-3-phosphate synthase
MRNGLAMAQSYAVHQPSADHRIAALIRIAVGIHRNDIIVQVFTRMSDKSPNYRIHLQVLGDAWIIPDRNRPVLGSLLRA